MGKITKGVPGLNPSQDFWSKCIKSGIKGLIFIILHKKSPAVLRDLSVLLVAVLTGSGEP